jgi:class 3 adenylate cyclase
VKNSELKQRLGAILAADAAEYSRLMATDERATVAALDAARAIFRAVIDSNHGRVIDMAGDSVLRPAPPAMPPAGSGGRRIEPPVIPLPHAL